jgi:predicted transcriptional regulator with HTH domain
MKVNQLEVTMATSLKRTVTKGTVFRANSKGIASLWEVSRRIKTDEQNVIYTKCLETEQTRKYTGKQFGMLIRMGIIHMVVE